MNLYDLLTIDRSSLYGVRRGLGSIADLLPGFQSTRPMRGATTAGKGASTASLYFNPRAPCGARQREGQPKEERIIFQSTHPLRGATFCPWIAHFVIVISIHAPLAGRDWRGSLPWRRGSYFNPRAPCGVRRSGTRHDGHCPYFNPRTPCGVRLRPLS